MDSTGRYSVMRNRILGRNPEAFAITIFGDWYQREYRNPLPISKAKVEGVGTASQSNIMPVGFLPDDRTYIRSLDFKATEPR
jgi:hypothetical protein